MKHLLSILFITITFISISQEKLTPPSVQSNNFDSIIIPEQTIGERYNQPTFPGGINELLKYISNEFDWNCIYFEDSNQSKIYFSFIVQEDGSINNIRTNLKPNDIIDDCCEQFIKNMPKWKPASNDIGTYIPQRVRLPITICLN